MVRYNLIFVSRMSAAVIRDENEHVSEVHIVFIRIIRRQMLKNFRTPFSYVVIQHFR